MICGVGGKRERELSGINIRAVPGGYKYLIGEFKVAAGDILEGRLWSTHTSWTEIKRELVRYGVGWDRKESGMLEEEWWPCKHLPADVYMKIKDLQNNKFEKWRGRILSNFLKVFIVIINDHSFIPGVCMHTYTNTYSYTKGPFINYVRMILVIFYPPTPCKGK